MDYEYMNFEECKGCYHIGKDERCKLCEFCVRHPLFATLPEDLKSDVKDEFLSYSNE